MGHIGLNVTDTRGSGVFARFIIVVKEIRGSLSQSRVSVEVQKTIREIFRVSLSTYKTSSGRDMVAMSVYAQMS